MKVKLRNSKRCRLCLSSMRPEIDALIRKGVPLPDIAKKFWKVYGSPSEHGFYMTLYRHVNNNHGPRIVDLTPLEPSDIQKNEQGEITFEGYADKLLSSAMTNEELFTGKRISHQAVVAARRAVLEERKLKTQEDHLKLAMIQFLRGQGQFIKDETLQEAEVIDEGGKIKEIEA